MRLGENHSQATIARAGWIAVALLTLVNVINYIDRMLVTLLAGPLKEEFQLSDTEFSLLSGLAFVTMYSVAGVFLARLGDLRSPRAVVAGSLAAWSMMTIFCGTAQNYLQLLVARMGVGIGEAGGIPSSYSIISGYFDEKRRVVPMAIFSAGSTVGILLCFVLGGLIYENWGWRVVFIAAAVPGFLLAILVASFVQDPPRAVSKAPYVTFLSAMRELGRNKPFVWLVAAQSIAAFGNIGIIQWLPLFMMRNHGLSVPEIGLFFGPIIAVGMTIGLAVGGWSGGKLARTGAARALHLCTATTLLLVPLYTVALWLPRQEAASAVIILAVLVGVIYAPPYIAAMQTAVHEHMRATAAAVAGIFSSFVGAGLLPLAVGVSSDLLRPLYGADSLRIGITAVVWILPISALLFHKAARSLIQANEADARKAC